ncbi:LAFE_0B02168g1_1 [Lachancea fermentati]|uniref:Eukaryotic translation initiation factor 3 subunit J n=1 Tax=Lachancea fermentati TaxID=4955 RepID=A0A1G4M7W0_LACFM|nr:LAFE_0B02168g1_1 [Lachancea fermentati]
MSWDDEEFEVPITSKDAPVMASWDDEFAAAGDDDEALLDSWDAEETKKPAPAKKQTASKPDKKKDAKGKGSQEKVLLEIDTLDEKTRKELLKKAELDADLNNAADLFGGLGVAEEHPRARALKKQQEEESLLRPAAFTKDTPIESHPLFQAETKSDFQDLRKALSTAITSMHSKSSLNYSSALAIDLIRDVAKPMSIESIRQTIATLNVLMKDKERQERQARLAKVRGGTATGGAGKKKAKAAKANLGGAFKKDQDFDLDGSNFDDFGDDDFM